MADENLIASIFSSFGKTSLSVHKAVSKKKKTAIVKKSASTKQVAVAPPPPVDEGWVEATSKNAKKKRSAFGGSSQAAAHPPSFHAAASSSKSDLLATNAFYLPKRLEKHLHKVPTPSSLKPPTKRSFEVVYDEEASGTTTKLTKSQKKNQLRAQKRAKKRAEKGKAALLQKKLQGLSVVVDDVKKVVPSSSSKDHDEDVEMPDTDTAATVASSEGEATPSTKGCLLLSLPYDVLTNGVLSFLRPEEMHVLGLCSRYSGRVCEEGFLWQNLFKQRFPASQLTPTAMKEWKLAYQLSLTKIVDRLRCPTTNKTFMEDVIGVGVDFTANPKTGSVDYIELSQDLLSETAFFKNKVRQDVFGNSFKLFLPLFFSAEHFKRALPQIQKTIAHLARNRRDGTFQRFHPNMILDVFPNLVTTFVVLLSDNGISACQKSYQGLIRIHRLFLALAHKYPEIQREALNRLKLFVGDEKYQTKKGCPNLGAILPLLMIVDEKVFGWPQLRLPYMRETFDRTVLWTCKKFPQLERTHDSVTGKVESEAQADARVELTLQAAQVTFRLSMFHVYLNRALCQGTTQERANRYDRFFGQPEPKEMVSVAGAADEEEEEDCPSTKPKPTTGKLSTVNGDTTIRFTHFREQINYIMSVQTWQKFLVFVGLPCPNSKAEMARRLRCHVANSRRKKYHTAGMDFARVQASGTSRILSKGQEYSASSELRHVVFQDDWSFEGGTKFLDATCLVYKGKKLLKTVDYQRTWGSNGAVQHSGDVMTETTGSHTINLNLDALDKEVTSCVFVLSAWCGATLADIKSPKVSFSNAEAEGDAPLCSYDLDSQDKVDYLTSVIMCRLYRVSGGAKQGWHVQAIGDAHKGDASNYGPIYEAVKKLL